MPTIALRLLGAIFVSVVFGMPFPGSPTKPGPELSTSDDAVTEIVFVGHSRPGDGEPFNSLWSPLLRKLSNRDVDALVLGGDLIAGYEDDVESMGSSWDSLRTRLDPMASVCQIVFVPGNHDVFSVETARAWERHMGALYGRVKVDHSLIIWLSSNALLPSAAHRRPHADDDFSDFFSDTAQLNFLRRSLESALLDSSVSHVFLFLHHDIWNDRLVGRTSAEWVRRWDQEIVPNLASHPKFRAVVSGNGNNESIDEMRGGVRHVTQGWHNAAIPPGGNSIPSHYLQIRAAASSESVDLEFVPIQAS